MTAAQVLALRQLAEALAKDVGRLRYTLKDDRFLVDRLASRAWALRGFVEPTAAAIYRANLTFGFGEEEAVQAALEDVDDRARSFARLLGEQVEW